MTKRRGTVLLRRDMSSTAMRKAMKLIDRGYVESWQLCDVALSVWKVIMRDKAMRAQPTAHTERK